MLLCQENLKFIFQLINTGIVNILKILKRSEHIYTIMEIKSLDKNQIPYVVSKHPVLLSLFFFCIEIFG